jgi:Zn-dependent metalloprotease
MKKNKVLAIALLVFFNTHVVFAGNLHGGKDPLEISFIKNNKAMPDLDYQGQLRSTTAWKEFSQAHSTWSVEFNESNQMPHRAFGKPILVKGNDPKDAALNFISTELSSWNISMNNLKFQTISSSKKYHNVFFYQTYNGLDVLYSQVMVKMTKDYRVNTWGIDTYKIDMPITPALSVNDAAVKAQSGITTLITNSTTPKLKILPVPEGRSVVMHLVYELTVSTITEEKAPSEYYTLVDANTGVVLYRHDKVSYAQNSLNTNVNVNSMVYEFNPYVTASKLPLKNLRVTVGTNTYMTDSLGNVSLPTTTPLFANFYLEGLWSKVFTDQGTIVPHLLKSITNLVSDSANFDATTSIRHTSGYFHVNNIHDFMKSFFPAFTGLDFALPTRIDVTGGACNAFYNGTAINFYETGSGCNCMSQIGDVVYHEYGHGINDKFYVSLGGNFENSGMNEGYADVWGFSLTKQPIIGKGTNIGNPNSYIRRYDGVRKVYPTNMSGDPHDVGEIIAGAWYDTKVNMNSWPMMTDLYARTFFDLVSGPDGSEGTLFPDILLAALNEDDDDADLSNGTPHDQEILDAFALHGIFLINNATFNHNEMYSALSQQPITVTADLHAQISWITTDLNLYYRTDNSSAYTAIPMTQQTGITYSADIPAQAGGSIISYYIKLTDSFSRTLEEMPTEADTLVPNIPYFILVSCIQNHIEDFDMNQSAGWLAGISTDSATGGRWIIAQPLVSFKSGDTCQTGTQHTPGGTNCAVTGNAVSVSSPNYNADVDNGKTTLESPAIDLTGTTNPVVTYWRWYTNDQGSAPRADYWKTYVSGDGVNYIQVENCGAPDHQWRRFAFKVSDYIPSATTLYIRYVAEDHLPESIIEAAVDDIEIFSADSGNGISSPEMARNLSIYPSPATTNLTIDYVSDKSGNVTCDVVNNLGQKVYSTDMQLIAGKNSKTIDVKNLSAGVYHLVIGNVHTRAEKIFSIVK